MHVQNRHISPIKIHWEPLFNNKTSMLFRLRRGVRGRLNLGVLLPIKQLSAHGNSAECEINEFIVVWLTLSKTIRIISNEI